VALAPLERAQLHRNTREDYRLIQSIEGGCLQDFDDALLAGASIEATDMGRSLLEISQYYQRPEFARHLLARGADPDQHVGCRGDTLLHRAARTGDIGFTVVLVEKGATVNAQNEAGQTPLVLATRMGFEFLARHLLENRADPNLADNRGNGPLHVAADKGNNVLAKLLLKHNAKIDRHRDPTLWKRVRQAAEIHGQENAAEILLAAESF